MKIKTSNLTGAALDWAVALCEGATDLRRNTHRFNDNWIMDWPGEGEGGRTPRVEYLADYSPSNSWKMGGPIIEREGITTAKDSGDYYWQAVRNACIGSMFGQSLSGDNYQEGSTALIAAMRCYVASTLGEEIEIPDDLT